MADNTADKVTFDPKDVIELKVTATLIQKADGTAPAETTVAVLVDAKVLAKYGVSCVARALSQVYADRMEDAGAQVQEACAAQIAAAKAPIEAAIATFQNAVTDAPAVDLSAPPMFL